jgi:hypothetical protein
MDNRFSEVTKLANELTIKTAVYWTAELFCGAWRMTCKYDPRPAAEKEKLLKIDPAHSYVLE